MFFGTCILCIDQYYINIYINIRTCYIVITRLSWSLSHLGFNSHIKYRKQLYFLPMLIFNPHVTSNGRVWIIAHDYTPHWSNEKTTKCFVGWILLTRDLFQRPQHSIASNIWNESTIKSIGSRILLGVYTTARIHSMSQNDNELAQMWHHFPTKSCWSQVKKIKLQPIWDVKHRAWVQPRVQKGNPWKGVQVTEFLEHGSYFKPTLM